MPIIRLQTVHQIDVWSMALEQLAKQRHRVRVQGAGLDVLLTRLQQFGREQLLKFQEASDAMRVEVRVGRRRASVVRGDLVEPGGAL